MAGAPAASGLFQRGRAPQGAGSLGPWRGAAAPPLLSPRFRRRPGGGRDRGRAKPSPAPGSCRCLPAPLRVHSQAAGVASTGAQGFGHSRKTLSKRDAGRGWLVLRFASARAGPLGTCGLLGAGTQRGHGQRLPPRRAGRENPASGASFLSLTRGDTGGPDPPARTGGPRRGPTGSRISSFTGRLGAPVLAL